MKYFIILMCLLGSLANAKTIKIAVIDSGFNPSYIPEMKVKLCKNGSYDYGIQQEGVPGRDLLGHGTKVTEILVKYLKKDVDYCIMVMNVEQPYEGIMIDAIPAAIRRAVDAGAHILNVSLIGTEYSHLEVEALKYASDRRVWSFIAAGNDNVNLDSICIRYPVCYKGIKRMIRIGAVDMFRNKASYSNYGTIIDRWEVGDFPPAHGTSFATPRAISKMVNYVWSKRNRK